MDNLEKYLEFFESCINNDKVGTIIKEEGHIPFVNYHKTVSDFLQDFYDSELLDKDYVENMNKFNNIIDTKKISSKLDIATMLTHIVRKDRFVEGYLLKNIVNGTIYRILVKTSDDSLV